MKDEMTLAHKTMIRKFINMAQIKRDKLVLATQAGKVLPMKTTTVVVITAIHMV